MDKNIKSDVEIIQDRLPEICNNAGCTDLYVNDGFHSEDVVRLGSKNHVNLHFTKFNKALISILAAL